MHVCAYKERREGFKISVMWCASCKLKAPYDECFYNIVWET